MSAKDQAALLRLEHKVDALITYLKSKDASFHMPPISGMGVQCPVCQQFVRYTIDALAATVGRACGCAVPTALSIASPATPTRSLPDVHDSPQSPENA